MQGKCRYRSWLAGHGRESSDVLPKANTPLPCRSAGQLRDLTITMDWVCFWRESTRDGFYGPAVNLTQSGKTSNARYVGHQAELMLEWRADRHFTFSASYARFFAGDFLKQTTPEKDVGYFSTWVT